MGLQGISAYASHSLDDEIVASEQGRTSKIRYRPYGVVSMQSGLYEYNYDIPHDQCAAAIAFK